MNIHIDIGHPAHVHYFKHFYWEMSRQGHRFLVTARDKDVTHNLLRTYDIPFTSRGRGGRTLPGKACWLVYADVLLLTAARRFRPDVFLSFSSPYAAHAAFFLRKPHIAFDDTENAGLGRIAYRWATHAILSPEAYQGPVSPRHHFFPGFMELLYLHPDRFAPDRNVTEVLGTEYIIVRFVAGQAVHDMGRRAMSDSDKRQLVYMLARNYTVYVSSESPLPDDLVRYRIPTREHQMHDALAGASVVISEGATTAAEAALLGTPALYINNSPRGYLDRLATYGLLWNYPDAHIGAIHRQVQAICDESAAHFRSRAAAVVAESVDVVKYLQQFVESLGGGSHYGAS